MVLIGLRAVSPGCRRKLAESIALECFGCDLLQGFELVCPFRGINRRDAKALRRKNSRNAGRGKADAFYRRKRRERRIDWGQSDVQGLVGPFRARGSFEDAWSEGVALGYVWGSPLG